MWVGPWVSTARKPEGAIVTSPPPGPPSSGPPAYEPPSYEPPSYEPQPGAPGPGATSDPYRPSEAPDGSPPAQPYESATPETDQQRPVGFDQRGRVKRGRVSALWIGLIAAAIFLILLIIFIAQNLKNATIHFLGASGSFPIGLTILIAAIVGLLLVAIPGSIRILQLRRALKINTPKDQRTPHS